MAKRRSKQPDEQPEPITPVIFRKWRDTGEVLALFPAEPGTLDPTTCSSFATIGGHCSADLHGVMRRTVPATKREYAETFKVLTGSNYGYRLRVLSRTSPHHYDARRAAINHISEAVR